MQRCFCIHINYIHLEVLLFFTINWVGNLVLWNSWNTLSYYTTAYDLKEIYPKTEWLGSALKPPIPTKCVKLKITPLTFHTSYAKYAWLLPYHFNTPVFRRDVLWYGDVRPSFRPSARFLHFSHTCFDIMSWNFAHDFVLMYYRSSSSFVNFRQFL